MDRLVLPRGDIEMPIKKLCESISGGRNPDDAIAFIDYNDNVRVAGLNTASRFGGAAPECPAIMLCLPNQEKASKLYATSRTIYILSERGALYASGNNSRGQCFLPAGSGTADQDRPVLTALTSNIVKMGVSADLYSYSAMALDSSGNVYAAGVNQYGQIGNGLTADTGNTGPKLTLGPNNTFGNPTTPVADIIGVGSYNGTNFPETYCALLTTGAVYCVGYGGVGAVGNGASDVTNSLWKQVIRADNNQGLSNITKIGGCGQDSAGTFYALDNTGSLWSWGDNRQGQLGLGITSANVNKATQVTPFGNSNIVDIFPFNNQYGSIIVKQSNKTYWGCGDNGYGQLGLGDTTDRNSFLNISSLNNKDVDMVYLPGYEIGHVIALSRSSNVIYGCGYNAHGNLGLGNLTTPVTSFTEIPFRPISPIIDVMPVRSASIGNYTLALTADGNTYFAGQSRYNYVGKPNRNVVYFSKNTSYMLGK